jgi:uncharacterized membrane protein
MLLRKPKALLSTDIQDEVVRAIRAAEARTTGELRVFVESHCTYVDAMDRAKELFKELAMEKTGHRNAVLVYLALADKQFAIFGDEQIYIKAGGPVFWKAAGELLLMHFKAGRISEGLCGCIEALGAALEIHFPPDPTVDKNELPDEIVFGK